MSDWTILAAVFGVALVISIANYLVVRRSLPHRWGGEEPPVDRMPQAYRVMEASLTSQAARLDAQSRRMDELEAEIVAQRAAHQAEMGALRAELEEAYRGIKTLLRQLGEAKIAPEWSPPSPAPLPVKRKGGGGDVLARRIASAFSREEIDGLAFDVEIDPESLGGESKGARVRELVTAAAQQGKLNRLVELCRELRPEGGF